MPDRAWDEHRSKLEEAVRILGDPDADPRSLSGAVWLLEEAWKAGRFEAVVREAIAPAERRIRQADGVEPGSPASRALDLLRTMRERDLLLRLASDAGVEPAVREKARDRAALTSDPDEAWTLSDECPECGGEVENVDRIVLRTGGPDKRFVTLWTCRDCEARLHFDSTGSVSRRRVLNESAFETWRRILARCPRPRRHTCECESHGRLQRM